MPACTRGFTLIGAHKFGQKLEESLHRKSVLRGGGFFFIGFPFLLTCFLSEAEAYGFQSFSDFGPEAQNPFSNKQAWLQPPKLTI